MAVTSSGDPTKACVLGFPSALFAKFLLNEWTIVFLSSFSAPSLDHCPIQGSQAFANTFAPSVLNSSMKPSLSIVCLTCSDPGVMVNSALVDRPNLLACLAIDTERDMSS